MSVFYFNLSPLKVKYVFMHIFVCTYKHTNIYSVKTFLLVQHFQVNSNQIRSYSSSYNNNIQIPNLYRTTSIIITLTFFFFWQENLWVFVSFFLVSMKGRHVSLLPPWDGLGLSDPFPYDTPRAEAQQGQVMGNWLKIA